MSAASEEGDSTPSETVESQGRYRRKLLVLGLSFAVSLVVAELALRSIYPVGGVIYQLDDELLHDARPSAARIQRMPAAAVREGDATRVRIRTGREGFRGGSLDVPKRFPRVLVLGDSFVMAENVPEENTFVHRLGVELERALGAASIETVNAGRSGYGFDQSLLLFERRVGEVRPDVVVCVICAHNDFGDFMRNKLVRIAGDSRSLELCRPKVGQRIREMFAERSEKARGLALLKLVADARTPDATFEVEPSYELVETYAVALRQQFEDHRYRPTGEVESIFEDVFDADLALGVDSEAELVKVRLAELTALRMAEVAEEAGALLRFVVVPSAVDVCQDFGIVVPRDKYPLAVRGRLVELWTRALSTSDVPVFDVTAALSEGREPLALDEFFVGGLDAHWNAAGQRRGAEGVSQWLAGDKEVVDALRGNSGD